MRKLICLIVLIVVAPVLAAAQSQEEHPVQGYVFAAPGYGFSSPNVHFGVGVDGLVGKGVGVGAEIGYLSYTRSNLRGGFGLFSPNVSYHFVNKGRSGKFDPFVTGGYSLAFRRGVAHAVNFGGGVNYWFKDRLGLRFEVRDHAAIHRDAHLVGFRFGVTFR